METNEGTETNLVSKRPRVQMEHRIVRVLDHLAQEFLDADALLKISRQVGGSDEQSLPLV